MPKVLLERRGRVAIVTLNNDERRNALSFEVRQGLREAFDESDADDSVGCVVLTANGRAFCAGGDLEEMAQPKTTR
jgi:enoyl-CoA hydratase